MKSESEVALTVIFILIFRNFSILEPKRDLRSMGKSFHFKDDLKLSMKIKSYIRLWFPARGYLVMSGDLFGLSRRNY